MNNIKTWQERWHEDFNANPSARKKSPESFKDAEIAELRAALASQASKGAGAPEGWREFLTEIANAGKDMNGSYYVPRAVALLSVLSPAQAQPVAFVPGGLQAMVDMTGQPAMYGETSVLPRQQSDFQLGRAAGMEEAAKLAENCAYKIPFTIAGYPCTEVHTPKHAGNAIAAAIRALAAKPAEGA